MPKVRHSTANFSARQLQAEAGLDQHSSLSTIYRVLHSSGYRFSHLKKKGILTGADRRARLQWVKINSSRPLAYWCNVALFLDCVSFIYKPSPSDTARASKAKAWLRQSEKLKITAKGRREHDGKFKTLRYLVAVSHAKGVVLCHRYERMTGTLFAKLIRQKMPLAFTLAGKPARRVLQDNDPCQNCVAACRAFSAVGAVRLRIPPRSPDLNPIENIFNVTKQELCRSAVEGPILRETEDEFAQRVVQTLYASAALHADRTIESMPKRLKLIASSGGHRCAY